MVVLQHWIKIIPRWSGNCVAMRERVITLSDFNVSEVILHSPLILAVGEL